VATDPYYFYDVSTDWQLGATSIFVGAPADNQAGSSDFRQAVRQGVDAMLKASPANAIDQCIVMPGDAYVVAWVHSPTSQGAVPVDWGKLGPKVRPIASMNAQRVICHGEPPIVTLDQTKALNFIFLRASEMFLF
jgi:hypothetical protein